MYIEHPEKQQQLYKRTLWIVIISQMLGGAGLAAGITVGALIAEDMLGTNAFAGAPVALFTLGSAGAALYVGRISNRFGRRAGLATGFLAGGIGAIGVIIAAILHSIMLLFIALLIYGAGTATNLQARYAGTDLATKKQRGTAVSMAMVATTFGAVLGPNLVEVMGDFALSIGIPELAGPFILSAVAFIFAGVVLFIFLRPDPYLIAQKLNQHKNLAETSCDTITETADKQGIRIGAIVMVISQTVMVAVMTMTPVYMGANGHGLRTIGFVIGLHIAGMYLPSLFTGVLVDKIGRPVMVIASALTLLLSGLVAAFGPGESVFSLTVALVLLGVGWNFGLISGTALLVDSTEPSTRAKTQGSVDVFIALAGAIAGALSGVVVAIGNFALLSILGGLLSLVMIPLVQSKRKG